MSTLLGRDADFASSAIHVCTAPEAIYRTSAARHLKQH